LFGNHKTALKAGWGKYNSPLTGTAVSNFNAMAAGTSEIVQWVGAPTTPCMSQTAQPGCYAAGNGFNQGNIGANPNPNFGQVNSIALDRNFHREYQLQFNVGVQHELRPGVTLNFAWNHMADYQQVSVLNYAVPASAWTQVAAVNPLDGSPLPLFNLQPAYSGLKPNLYQTNGAQRLRANSYNGFETSVVARLPHGAFVLGAWTIDRSLNRACDENTSPQLGAALNDPNSLRFCDWTGGLYQNLGAIPTIPYRNEFKLQGHVPIRWGLEASASLLSDPVFGDSNGQLSIGAGALAALSGFKPVTWNLTAATRYPDDCTQCPKDPSASDPNRGAIVDPGLSPGQGSEAIKLIAPGTRFYPRLTQFDVGLRRVFRIHDKYTLMPQIQVFNFFNSNTVLLESTTLGTSVKPFVAGGPGGQVTSVLNPRAVQMNVQFKF
jgi:hypothetical protein